MKNSDSWIIHSVADRANKNSLSLYVRCLSFASTAFLTPTADIADELFACMVRLVWFHRRVDTRSIHSMVKLDSEGSYVELYCLEIPHRDINQI
jgi:hypothetical protein